MKEFEFKYIVEKDTIGRLVLCINGVFVPQWFVEVVRHLAMNHPNEEIFIAYSTEKNRKEEKVNLIAYRPFVVLEKYVFRQKLRAFDAVNIIDAFTDIPSVECVRYNEERYRAVLSSGNTCVISLCDDNGVISSDRDVKYPLGILRTGIDGVIRFMKQYLVGRNELLVHAGSTLVWKHLFQTLAYSIDKNSNFFKAAVKQSIECLWRAERDVNYKSERSDASAVTQKQLISYWITWSITRIYQRIKKVFYHKRWVVLLQSNGQSLKKLHPKGGDGWADPFIIDDQYLFVEQIDAKTGKGHLEVCSIDGKGQTANQTKVIDEPFHLSYPNVMKIDKRWIMIPESAASKSLRLYVSDSFPYEWRYERSLKTNAQFLDFTPFHYSNTWWMFSVVKAMPDGGSYDQLFLFYSDDILNGEWVSHKQNPIVTDSSSARPAGNLYVENGVLYRPSQDCLSNYGSGIKINKVLSLTKDEYKEECCERINPKSLGIKAIGVHTVNKSNLNQVFDAQIWDFKI